MNRRDLLKYFSAGAVITPLAISATPARIIEPPKIEPVKMIQVPIDYRSVKAATVTMEMHDGSVRQIAMDCTSQAWAMSDDWAELSVFRFGRTSPGSSVRMGGIRGAVTVR